MGRFLEGTFAPLAFLWLVMGYFLQQKELSENTTAIQKQHIEIQKVPNAQRFKRQIFKRQIFKLQVFNECAAFTTTIFYPFYEMVRVSLGSIVGRLYIPSQGQGGSELIDSDEMTSLWPEMINRDAELFARRFLFTNVGDKQDMLELLYGSEIRTRHSHNFMHQFRRIVDNAKACVPDGMLLDAI